MHFGKRALALASASPAIGRWWRFFYLTELPAEIVDIAVPQRVCYRRQRQIRFSQ